MDRRSAVAAFGSALRQFPDAMLWQCSASAFYRVVTARRSNGPANCRNHTGGRIIRLHAPYVMKHAVLRL
jgi:hypothetical protein